MICEKTGKIRHNNYYCALRAAFHFTSISKKFLEVYKCPYCKGWHLTKQDRIKRLKKISKTQQNTGA